MKNILYLFITVFICDIGVAQNVPNYHIIDGDTINIIDENNLRQGFWKIFGKMKRVKGYEPDQVVEQGKYGNNRKKGLWTKFFRSGKTQSEIEYRNSRPNGAYRTYYENGQIEEEGNWKNNRNTAAFKRYYENGQVSQDFAFNPTGKRDGKQTYFYENGQIMIEAVIAAGKEEFVKEYYQDGSIKSEKSFIDGKLDTANTKIYHSKSPVKDRDAAELKNEPIEIVKIEETEKSNLGGFKGEGQHKMYNSNREISKDGFFKAYVLIDGLHYQYDENGILIKVKRYQAGRYIGDAPLPKK
jgi:antitoxin component YwqK of YwqJK toxin-antitoxin module